MFNGRPSIRRQGLLRRDETCVERQLPEMNSEPVQTYIRIIDHAP